MDREWMWFKVLASRYGEERGRLKIGGRDDCSWWRKVELIDYGM